MNNQPLMRVGYAIADFQEKCQPVAQLQGCGVLVDRNAVDVLHHQVWLIIRRMSGVDQTDYRRVIQVSQKLPFPQESVSPGGSLNIGTENFYGDGLFYLSVTSFRQVHGAHSSRSEHARQAVGSNLLFVDVFPHVEIEK